MERGSLDPIKETDISMVPRICPKCGNLLIEYDEKRTKAFREAGEAYAVMNGMDRGVAARRGGHTEEVQSRN